MLWRNHFAKVKIKKFWSNLQVHHATLHEPQEVIQEEPETGSHVEHLEPQDQVDPHQIEELPEVKMI